MRSEKGQIKKCRKDQVWLSREEKKEEKERKITFVTEKVIEKMTARIGKSG